MSPARILRQSGLLLAACLPWTPALASEEEQPICTDRPAKANATCTVPDGAFQIESSGIGWTRSDSGATRTDLLLIGASTLKLGLSERSDLQLGFVPFAELTERQSGTRRRISGPGDLIFRYKHRLSAEGDGLQWAVIPFLKLPTAGRGLGNGKVEGGLAVPLSFSLTGPVTMTFGPELDMLADADGAGRHLNVVNLVNVSAPVAPRLTLAGELWTAWNFDPSGIIRQVSADAALAWAPARMLQLDVGANVGLNRQTPDLELYAGISVRF